MFEHEIEYRNGWHFFLDTREWSADPYMRSWLTDGWRPDRVTVYRATVDGLGDLYLSEP
jgi:hypothetical protein